MNGSGAACSSGRLRSLSSSSSGRSISCRSAFSCRQHCFCSSWFWEAMRSARTCKARSRPSTCSARPPCSFSPRSASSRHRTGSCRTSLERKAPQIFFYLLPVLRVVQAEIDLRFGEAELRAAVEPQPGKKPAVHLAALLEIELQGVRDAYLDACFRGIERLNKLEDARRDDVAPDGREVRGCFGGRRFFHYVRDLIQTGVVLWKGGPHEPVLRNVLHRHALEEQDRLLHFVEKRYERLKRGSRMDQEVIREGDGHRLALKELLRLVDGVRVPDGVLLLREQVGKRQVGVGEVLLHHPAVLAGDEDRLADAGSPRLLERIVHHRPVENADHRLRHMEGERKEAFAAPPHRQNDLRDFSAHTFTVSRFSLVAQPGPRARTSLTSVSNKNSVTL